MTQNSKRARYGATPAGAVPVGQGGARKWMQLRAVEDAREPLGLKATGVNILRAMISFMRADAISTAAPDHHIVYASNAAIARRAHVSVAVARLALVLTLTYLVCLKYGQNQGAK